ncbi:hypothetical protein DUI87_28309 [Hirundo rustica rustica]|uniref:rhomboid protease n=1 Tax=Hirundo rustica rustica TaxID=333673 RepID=A0A3M0J3G2_HIRRU|nr:hypothetical protein DUI87_28309 [Hirundo rustica rustica]
MGDKLPEPHASSSPAVAAGSEAEEIEVLDSEDVLPMAAEDFDPDNTGYISTEKFRSLLQRHGSELDPHKLEVLLALADSNSEGRICYQDFVNLGSGTARANEKQVGGEMLGHCPPLGVGGHGSSHLTDVVSAKRQISFTTIE